MVKKKSNFKKTISFDEEVVPKKVAQQILAKECETKKPVKKKRKRKEVDEVMEQTTVEQTASDVNSTEHDFVGTNTELSKTKKRKKQSSHEVDNINKDANEETDANSLSDPINSAAPKKKESIRERKRKRFAQLLQDKKIKSELGLQQKCLEYLSKWKHSRNDWKFEKLRQIWLLNNMYDSTKVPQEYWGTLVEYLSNSKGKAKEVILKKAVNIIEKEASDGDDNKNAERARDIIQNLQE